VKADIGMYQPYLKYSSIFIGLDFARDKEEPGTAEGQNSPDSFRADGCEKGAWLWATSTPPALKSDWSLLQIRLNQKRMIRATTKMILSDDPNGNKADGMDRVRLNGVKKAHLLYDRSAVSGVSRVWCLAHTYALAEQGKVTPSMYSGQAGPIGTPNTLWWSRSSWFAQDALGYKPVILRWSSCVCAAGAGFGGGSNADAQWLTRTQAVRPMCTYTSSLHFGS
jgi:hypothetical protein